jgi:hypothetical protein
MPPVTRRSQRRALNQSKRKESSENSTSLKVKAENASLLPISVKMEVKQEPKCEVKREIKDEIDAKERKVKVEAPGGSAERKELKQLDQSGNPYWELGRKRRAYLSKFKSIEYLHIRTMYIDDETGSFDLY